MKRILLLLSSTMALALSLAGGLALAETRAFFNTLPITINDASETEAVAATPYPSEINVRNLSTTASIQDVNLTLFNLSHSYPDDVDVLVVGPQGQKALVMSDSGGRHDVVTTPLTFDDEATDFLPDSTQIPAEGTFKPTQGTSNPLPENPVPANFPSPAPPGPYATALSVFDGTNPNGTWKLYVIDDTEVDAGAVGDGWSLEITTDTQAPRVTATSPDKNAPGVSRTANVTATFSEAMNEASVEAPGVVTLKRSSGGSAVGASINYNPTTEKVTLNPNASLARNTLYTARVTTGARDVSGNPLDQNATTSGNQAKTWKFTTVP